MKLGKQRGGFTLVEMLVAMAVLVLVVVLASRMTSATLSTVSHSNHTLETSENIRTATQMLRDELAVAFANRRPGRYLNLRVVGSEDRVVLYLAVPHAKTADLTRMGFVTHVAYIWDKERRTLGRVEYHSSQEPETVEATASSLDSTDAAANVERLQKITPAYQGSSPYAWTESPIWQERLKEAQRNPLLTAVREWKVECFKTADIETKEPLVNEWDDPEKLPAAIRFEFVISNQQGKTGEEIGRRYVSLVSLPCTLFEP